MWARTVGAFVADAVGNFQREQTSDSDRDMNLNRGGAGVSSAYTVFLESMEFEQMTMATEIEIGSHGSLGGASEPHEPAYPSMQSHHAAIPSSSSTYHFMAGFFDLPGLSKRWEQHPRLYLQAAVTMEAA